MGKKPNGVLNLRIKTDEKLEEKFTRIKEELGLNSNAEVVRFLIHKYYKELVAKGGSLLLFPCAKMLPKVYDILDVSLDFSLIDTVDMFAYFGLGF